MKFLELYLKAVDKGMNPTETYSFLSEEPYLWMCVLQKRLRHELKIHIDVVSHRYNIKELSLHPITYRYVINGNYCNDLYKSHEDALMNGLFKTLNLLK